MSGNGFGLPEVPIPSAPGFSGALMPPVGPQHGAGMPGPPAFAPQPKKKRKWLIAVVIIGILFGLVALVVGGGFAYISFWQGRAQDNVPMTAAIGECYGDDGSFETVPCTDFHSFEVFSSVVYLPNTDYPGRLARIAGNEWCDMDLVEFTDAGYWESDFDYAEVYPTEEAWQAGDRFVLCALYPSESSGSSGSAEGNG